MTPKDAPKRIYLQLGPDKPERDDKFSDYAEVTWCAEKINDFDVEYIRADIAMKSAWTLAIASIKKHKST